MIQKLEKYANNLEEIVQQRTAELVEEKQKTDTLLYRMLPEWVQTSKMFNFNLIYIFNLDLNWVP